MSILDLTKPSGSTYTLPKGTKVTVYRKLGGDFTLEHIENKPEDFGDGPYLGLQSPHPSNRKDTIVMEFSPPIKFLQGKATATQLAHTYVRMYFDPARPTMYIGDVSGHPIMAPLRDIQPAGRPNDPNTRFHRVELLCEDPPNVAAWDQFDVEEA